MTTISTLPTAPSRDRPTTFAAEADAFLIALDPWAVQVNQVAKEVASNAVLAAASANAISLPDYTGTSSSANSIAVGSKTFATQSGKLWGVGMPVIARSGSNYMRGAVSSYTVGTLVILVDSIFGSGSFSDWTLSLYLAPTGARGGGSDAVFWENDTVIQSSYSLTLGKNAITAGPVTINNGVTVEIPSGSVWTIV